MGDILITPRKQEAGAGDDDNGFVDDSESRYEDEKSPSQHEKRYLRPADSGAYDDRQRSLEQTSESEEEIADFLALIRRETSWSGLLPPPESFLQYPEFAQHAIVEWNNVQIVEGSHRDDRSLKLSHSRRILNLWLSFAINALFAVLALASFILTQNPNSFWFLSVPGVTIAVSIIFSRRKQTDDDPDSLDMS